MKKKHLGQHFLHEQKVIERIASASQAAIGSLVVEIGPGEGALTAQLLANGFVVVAVECDRDLIDGLQSRFQIQIASGQLQVIVADILTVELSQIVPEIAEYYVIANIPYYITGAIIQHFLQSGHTPLEMVLVMQREVADRIIAQDSKHSLLSLSVHLYGKPKKIMNIGKGAFTPPPDVESSVLLIENIGKTPFPEDFSVNRFFELAHLGFGQKRKQLYVNLKSQISLEVFEKWAAKYKLANTVRAEDLPPASWVDLTLLTQ